MMQPLRAIEAEDIPRYKRDLLNWEAAEAAYNAKKKQFIEHHSSEHLANDVAPEVPELPIKPSPLKLTVTDITSQKLVRHAAERPRGLLCYLDEMNSWVKKMTDKQSGEDRSTWVVSYESESYDMDRVGSGSIHADNLAVSVFGNIQPRVYRENLNSLTADGLLQRFGEFARSSAPSAAFATAVVSMVLVAAPGTASAMRSGAAPASTWRLKSPRKK